MRTSSLRLQGFYRDFGDCTQTQDCLSDGPTCATTCAPATQFAALMRPDGSFANVNYTDASPNVWNTSNHLLQCLSMLRAADCPACGAESGNATLIALAQRGLDFWLAKDFQNPNWWWNQIGIPQFVAELLVLLDTRATPAELAGGLTILLRSNYAAWTGQNLLWGLHVEMNRGVIENNASLVSHAFGLIWNSTVFAAGGADGIQPDGSFYQHGHLLQSGAYGADFAVDEVTLAALAAFAAEWQITPSALDAFASFILDGQSFMIRGPPPSARSGSFPLFNYDVLVKGREISRAPDGSLAFPSVVYAVAMANLSATPRGPEFDAFVARLNGTGAPLEAHRHFWFGDYAAFHRAPFFFGLKLWSNRTDSAECVNGENLKGWYMSAGLLLPYHSGAEYEGVFPVWGNWTTLPGLTAVQGRGETLCNVKLPGLTTAVGGVSNGWRGLAMMDFALPDFGDSAGYEPLTARKTWVFLEEGVVVLVSNLTVDASHTHTPGDVVTTVNNRLRAGSTVLVGTSSNGALSPLPLNDPQVLSDVDLVWHDGFVYGLGAPWNAAPAGTTVTAFAGNITGSWREISLEMPTDPVTVDTFTLGLNHGVAVNNVSFAYVIADAPEAPNATLVLADLAGRAAILANTPALQALMYTPPSTARAPDGWGAAPQLAFAAWVAGVVDGGAGFRVEVGDGAAPLAALVEADGSSVRFSFADPTNNAAAGTVTVLIDRVLTTGPNAPPGFQCTPNAQQGTTQVTATLPNGPLAGSTVVGECQET